MTTFASQDFDVNAGTARETAKSEPVIIMEPDQPALILLRLDEYTRTRSEKPFRSAAEALSMPEELWTSNDIDFHPEHSRELPREIDLS